MIAIFGMEDCIKREKPFQKAIKSIGMRSWNAISKEIKM
ncbi:hypothetical protein NNO_1706 [Hydrogenimonas sp.]|nr:hypothetical protein NNO_1706 [Hydrogenimonas sp.]